jgi:acyl carrier protein phosphodiesterase
MNFLMHAFLSGKNDKVLAGNFLGDFVKGKRFETFEEDIQKGILLHREIDYYSDNHLVFLKSKARLLHEFRHYSGVIIDVFYDHLLAGNFHEFSETSLKDYTEWVYSVVGRYIHLFPEKARFVFRYMSRDNWLYHYRSREGIRMALAGMSRRTKFDVRMERSIPYLEKYSEQFDIEFKEFLADIQSHSEGFLKKA